MTLKQLLQSAAVAFLLAVPSVAAELGPEFELSEPGAAEAALTQQDPSLASNGSGYLAMWRDQRRSHEPLYRDAVYVSLLNEAGRFVEPFGRRIADDAYGARVASNGRGYLVVYSDFTPSTFALHLDDEGRVTGQRSLVSSGAVLGLASNGRGFLALVSDPGQTQFAAVFLSEDGTVEARVDLNLRHDPALIAVGDDYAIVDERWLCDGRTACRVSVRLTTLDSETHAVTQSLVRRDLSQWSRVNAVSDGERILIGLISDGSPESPTPLRRTVDYMIVDSSGAVLVPPQQVYAAPIFCYCGTWRTSLAWDGREFVVGWPVAEIIGTREVNWRIDGIRVSQSGSVIDGSFHIGSAVSSEFVAARSRSGIALLSSESRRSTNDRLAYADVYARQAPMLSDFAVGAIREAVVESAQLQVRPAIALSGDRAVVAWQELDQPAAIRATTVNVAANARGPAVTLAERGEFPKVAPAAATIGNIALVVWRDEQPSQARIVGRRMRLDGTVVNEQPIAIGTAERTLSQSGDLSIATDGNQFLVIWTAERDLLAARVLPDGTVLDSTPILVSRDQEPGFRTRESPRATWTGASFLILWSDDVESPILVDPPFPPVTIIRIARVTSAGAVVDTQVSPTIVNAPGLSREVAIAFGRDTAMVLWPGESRDQSRGSHCINALALDREGRPVGSMMELACEQVAPWPNIPADVSVAWTGSDFVATWSSVAGREVRGSILSTSGAAGPWFAVSAPSVDAWGAAVAASAQGTVIVYSRITDDSESGVARLFVRTLDAQRRGRARLVR